MSKDQSRTEAVQAGAARQLTGRERIAAYLLQRIREHGDVDPGVAQSLAKHIADGIKRVVVWETGSGSEAHAHSEPAAKDRRPVPAAAVARGEPEPARPAAPAATASPEAAASSAPSDPPAFDPYAFSVVVVLTRTGKDGLMKKLATIERPEHLRKLAEAQHLAVDAALTSATELRAAITEAAARRIANRRAAAS